MIELEKTYLAKNIPGGIEKCKFNEIIDIYFPIDQDHPIVRLRQCGDVRELTKKSPIDGDPSRQEEQTIVLSEVEFRAFQQVPGKKLRKLRYYYDHDGLTAEIDVYQDDLKGLIVVDVEFKTVEEKEAFKMPDFCLVDVTSEVFAAAGMLAGKRYQDIEDTLNEFGYKKL